MLKRIFVVDDEKCIADTLAAILRKAGYESSAFYDAQSALQEVYSCTPELVISDVDMPGMNGVEMAICIRKNCQSCKVLLFSGRATTAEILKTAGEHGYHFELLSKPIHPTDLLAHIVSAESETESG